MHLSGAVVSMVSFFGSGGTLGVPWGADAIGVLGGACWTALYGGHGDKPRRSASCDLLGMYHVYY